MSRDKLPACPLGRIPGAESNTDCTSKILGVKEGGHQFYGLWESKPASIHDMGRSLEAKAQVTADTSAAFEHGDAHGLCSQCSM